jgi:aryl-alcohol dehydrogenase-like predicted oxidoreductase
VKYTILPNSDLKVSKICLGTMGYGDQVSETDAYDQMNMALEMGVNFIDTAEMYAVPPKAETYGATEEIIGRWFNKIGKRKDVVLASKVFGPARYSHVRDGNLHLDMNNIQLAVDSSLQRLQTDVIDLYQLHWPERSFNAAFGTRGFQMGDETEAVAIEETLTALKEIHQSGKVRYFGLSNETPWGTMEFLRLAREQDLPVMVSVQNPYSLLNRHYEIGMSEISLREDIPLLAYSPLGFGVLGGRYFDGNMPEGGRFTRHPEFAARYREEHVLQICKQYAELASKYDLSLAQLSLAFVNSQSFVASNIIGASNLDQLKENIESIDIDLSEEILEALELVHERYPNPVA